MQTGMQEILPGKNNLPCFPSLYHIVFLPKKYPFMILNFISLVKLVAYLVML